MVNYPEILLILILSAAITALVVLIGKLADFQHALRIERNRISFERLYQTYLASIPDGVAVIDRDGRIISTSFVLQKMVGADPGDDLTGRKIQDLLVPADRILFFQRLIPTPGQNTAGFNQYQALRADGSTFYVEITLKWLENREEERNRAVVILHDVTEHKRIEESEIRARKTAEALQAVGLVINSTLDYSLMLDLLLEQIGRVLTFDLASILMMDGDEICITAMRGFSRPEDIINLRFNLVNESPNSLVLEQRKPVIVNSVLEKYPSFKSVPEFTTQSWMGIPLFSRDEIIGFLNLDSREKDHFREQDKAVAEVFANQVAIALENARLYTETQRRLKDQAIQNEISRSISLKLNPDDFYEMLYRQVSRFIDIDIFIIANYEPGSERWETVYYRKGSLVLEAFISNLKDGFTGFVLQQKTPLFLPNSGRVEEFIRETGRISIISKPKSIMIAPLIVSDQVIGALGAQNDEVENAFSLEDFNLFTSISSQVAVAFENIRLFQRMEQLAMMDNLTQIFNRRHFFSMSRVAFDRADRYDRPFAVVMMDIDHFKKVNDTFGHTVGDQTLQAVALLLQRALRHTDVIGRYGGEEFAAVLPETNLEQARATAERLRRKVSEFEVETAGGPVRVTISIGISARIGKEDTLESLIDRADRGLYAAKSAGRDRVCSVD